MNNPRTIDIDSYIINSENKNIPFNSKIKIKIINNKIKKENISLNSKIKIINNIPLVNTQQIILSDDEFNFIYNDNYNDNTEDPININ
jgi:DNA-directed RNA polymerase subunit E'/Rpb7